MTKIYTLWDSDELCGIFSTLEKGRAAARKQVGYMKCAMRRDAKRFKHAPGIGKDIEEKVVYPPKLRHMPNAWFFGIEPDGSKRMPRGVTVYEGKLDKYDSLLKRIYSRKKRKR